MGSSVAVGRKQWWDPRLVVVTTDPLNAETRLDLHGGIVTPNRLFFMRNRFRIPEVDSDTWRLTLSGEVAKEMSLSYLDLMAMPSTSLLVTTECAGNGRKSMQPAPEGEPWQHGAVSTAEWTGVPLHALLDKAGVRPSAGEVVFEGRDRGPVGEAGEEVPFARSLPIDKAMHRDTLLAYRMNGEPLPVAHGFPVRLVVPDWYGMASVKWLSEIRVAAESFRGFFQVERYVMIGDSFDPPVQLTDAAVRSVIVSPGRHQRLQTGSHVIRGFAWSGNGLLQVEVSADGGDTWRQAEWTSPRQAHAWRSWQCTWELRACGSTELQSRATDTQGTVQPRESTWNQFGYACNAIQAVPVIVDEASTTS